MHVVGTGKEGRGIYIGFSCGLYFYEKVSDYRIEKYVCVNCGLLCYREKMSYVTRMHSGGIIGYSAFDVQKLEPTPYNLCLQRK